MRGRTELAKTMLDAEADYRLFSASAHSHSWALTSIGYEPSDRKNLHVKHVEPTTLAYLCLRSIQYFARALWEQTYFFGWRSGPFSRLLEEVYDAIEIAPNRRFWRGQVVAHI